MSHIPRRYTEGVTAVEVVLGISIAALVLVFTMYAVTQFVNASRLISQKTQALYLVEEGMEMVRFVRDESWSTFSGLPLDVTRYLTQSGSTITVTNTPEVIDGLTRSLTFSSVYRDTVTHDIVASTTGGSVVDTNTKYVTVTVSDGTPSLTLSLTSILTNLDP